MVVFRLAYLIFQIMKVVRTALFSLWLLVLIVACSKPNSTVLDASEFASFQVDGLSLVEWAPDHNVLALAGAKGVFLYQADTPDQELQQLSGATAAVTSLTFSPNGQYLVAGLKNGNLLLWSMGEKDPMLIVEEHHTAVELLAISPDSSMLASYAWSRCTHCPEDSDIHLWDIQSGQLLKRLSTNNIHAKVLAFTSDGNTVLVGTHNEQPGRALHRATIRRWDVKTGQEAPQVKARMDIAFSPNGQIAATGEKFTPDRILLWDMISGSNIDVLTIASGFVGHLTFSHNNTFLAGVSYQYEGPSNDVTVWDVKTGEALIFLPVTGPLAFHPCECLLATGNGARGAEYDRGGDTYELEDNIVRIWSVPKGELLAILDQSSEKVSEIRFSADGSWVAAVSRSIDTVHIWDIGLVSG